MAKILKFIIDWIWQFPQTLAGKIFSILWKKDFKKSLTVEEESLLGILEGRYKVKIYYVCSKAKEQHWFWSFISAFSSGKRIKVTSLHGEIIIIHEKGHSVCSLILGPLYLLLVGLPSGICNLVSRYFHTNDRGWSQYDRLYWYYRKLTWERLADWFGGVNRKAVLAKIIRRSGYKYRYPAMPGQVVI